METDKCIAEYLEKGYVDWNTHASLLADAEKQLGAGLLNEELSKHWSKYFDNFIISQPEFISIFREFLLKNWRDFRIQDVDGAVRFLQKLDPHIDVSDVLDEAIAKFAEQHSIVESPYMELHNVHADTIKRVKEKIASNSKPIPIDEAIQMLSRNGGWTPSDVKYIANKTADEFFDYFSSSQTGSLSRIKKLRSRLEYDETSKPVLERVDEALRRIAKRSKLDEARVRQTEVKLS